MKITKVHLEADLRGFCDFLQENICLMPELNKHAITELEKKWNFNSLKKSSSAYLITTAIDEMNSILGISMLTMPEAGVSTLIWLIVGSNHQNIGIGAKLLEDAKSKARAMNAHKIRLTTPSKRALNFYLQRGMRCEGILYNHWWTLNFWILGIDL